MAQVSEMRMSLCTLCTSEFETGHRNFNEFVCKMYSKKMTQCSEATWVCVQYVQQNKDTVLEDP